jgi:CheY-specific phosphatase CheX
MGIKFFGHYLLDEGKITNEQLAEVVEYQSKNNLSLGELAVRDGFINTGEANIINDKQRSLDKRFGEVAVSLKLLTDIQVEKLLQIQKSEKVFFGEILIMKNFMDKKALDIELVRFIEHEQIEIVELDDKIKAIDKDDIIKNSIGILQTLYSRIVHDPIKLVRMDSTSSINHKGIIALQKMRGDVHLDFALQPEDAVSLAISTEFLKTDFNAIDDMVIDIVCEFVNIVLGNIAVKFSVGSTEVGLTPPIIIEQSKFNYSGYYSFEFATTRGNLILYLKI